MTNTIDIDIAELERGFGRWVEDRLVGVCGVHGPLALVDCRPLLLREHPQRYEQIRLAQFAIAARLKRENRSLHRKR
ncbi:hypothetical protein KEM60_00086 [Austwickia sp. TVS 96-490-7B]|uniref:hypothetical protein n=1 Tax=Austwickia sp. TVS 96-490-7B TaxID=2830843 RepID=UPI001C5A53D8|nr:hypothetical protein [Austwickia sp. TVS 96-490-7B]MBW3083904.1 hypothetical protein [Austwickia sp. TVS 96-490-7B]